MKKKLSDYLPKEKDPEVFVQGRIPKELYDPIKEFMDKEDYKWPAILTAALNMLLDDLRRRKRAS